jgi:small-conductance mechanosensitive channel
MIFLETVSAAASTAQDTADATGGMFSTIWGMIPLIISAIVVIIAAFILSKFVTGVLLFRLSKRDLNREVLILIGRMCTYGILFVGILAATEIVGLNLGSLIAFLGVGIGFALKDLLSNFIAGIMILTQKKFKIGDTIKLGDILGKIVEIETRTTQIKSFDGTLLIIPNAQMITAVIENFSANEMRRISFEVGVHYNTPLQDSIQLAITSVKKHQKVMPEPSANVVATEFGDSAIILKVLFWIETTASWLQVKSEVIQQLKIDFDAAGIEIPFPIRTLTLDSNDGNLMQAMHLPEKVQQKIPVPEKKPEPKIEAETAKEPVFEPAKEA